MTSSRRPDNWIVPGGGVEPNEEPACTAVREVLEEAGVIGTLGRCLGMFEVRSTRTQAKRSLGEFGQGESVAFAWLLFLLLSRLLYLRLGVPQARRPLKLIAF